MKDPLQRRRYRYRYGPLVDAKRQKNHWVVLVLAGMLLASAVVRVGGGG